MEKVKLLIINDILKNRRSFSNIPPPSPLRKKRNSLQLLFSEIVHDDVIFWKLRIPLHRVRKTERVSERNERAFRNGLITITSLLLDCKSKFSIHENIQSWFQEAQYP